MTRTRVQQKTYEVFELDERHASPKGWITSPKECPWCGKDNHHFGIKFTKKTAKHNNEVSFHCFKCDVRGGEYLLFRQLDMLTFLQQGEYIKQDKVLEKKIDTRMLSYDKDDELDLEVVTRHKPFGFRRVETDEYLLERGFELWQFSEYVIGRTKLSHQLKNYVIFLVMENGENKGYVARIAWHKDKIEKEEAKTGRRVIRYRNEGGVDFAKLLFGIDELDAHTLTVILVEGVTDKANIDRLLNRLNLRDRIKCCCTFGKKISDEQAEKLYRKGIKNIVFLYDPDAIEASKQYSIKLKRRFKVLVGFLRDKDPGDLSLQEFENVMDGLEDPVNFSVNRVQKRKL